MTTLRTTGLTVRYRSGTRSLIAADGVDLIVPSGKVLGLVGESGSGKSTLARAIVGLAPIGGGRVLLDEQDVTRPKGPRRREFRRQVQMIFQDPSTSLDPRMSIGGTIGEAVTAAGHVSRQKRGAEVDRLLDLVALDTELAGRLPGELSGGQRQRVSIARALAVRPQVLIADEITSALDVSVQGAILNLVRDLQRRLGLSILFISHNLAVVRYVSDAVAVLHLGRVVEHAATADLLAAPAHPYTRSLVAAVPQLAASAGTGIEALDVEPPDPHQPPPGCRFHPRCPIGPAVHPDRAVCRTDDPPLTGSDRHQVACHFAST
jgi:peptide/nickel transport system ATP-binding protein